jgi:hypothetical protein
MACDHDAIYDIETKWINMGAAILFDFNSCTWKLMDFARFIIDFARHPPSSFLRFLFAFESTASRLQCERSDVFDSLFFVRARRLRALSAAHGSWLAIG